MSDPVARLNSALEGRYEIERKLGEGGMATVYLADDLKHERKVALKVLKPELAAVVGAERFLAEIKTTANLTHPNILPLHDSGEADSFLFYVMPYMEGETLQDRIDREKQLPVDESVRIATAIANALDHAHRNNVIHRDIKPANILLQDGEPVVADFGIALAVGAAGGSRLTETGLSLGTPFYMSPEQATGDQPVGASTDTYALGSVLYEMLVGDPPYPGSTAQAVLGKIIAGKPVSATEQRPAIPANIDAALRKALEKLPADRFTTAQEFARALGDPAFRWGEEVVAVGGRGLWNWLSLATTTVAAVALALAGWTLSRPEAEPGVLRFESPFRASQRPVAFGVNSFTISPDGSFAVYRGPGEAGVQNQLWVRRWDDLDAVPLRAGDLGVQPAVAPDGRQIAFNQGGEIRVLSLDGGPVRTVAGGTWPRWGPDGQIYMGGSVGVTRVAVSGGPVDTLTHPADGESQHFLWDVLPGGEEGLLHINLDDGTFETRVLSLSSGEIRPIDVFGGIPHYVNTGHIVFLEFTAATLMAAPFDAKAAELTGPAVPLYEDVVMFSLGRDGTLMYSTGAANAGADELVWVDRRGAATPVDPGWSFNRGGANYGWALSPDQTKVALRINTDGNNDIWIKHLPDGPLERLTFDPGEDRQPWWAPDGETVMYIHGPLDDRNIWSKRADGTGDPQLVLDDERSITQGIASPDGETLVFRTSGLTPNIGPRDIVTFRPGVDSAVVQLIGTPDFAEQGPSLSPDGRWIAYTSNETGSDEVYVRPFPDVNTTRVRVSTGGGLRPRWSHSGRELFYIDSDRTMVSIRVETEPGFRVVGREELFQLGQTYLATSGADFYDLSLDDQQFLMGRAYLTGDGGTDTRALVLVKNFFEELKERVPN